jgi:hypothetical protein
MTDNTKIISDIKSATMQVNTLLIISLSSLAIIFFIIYQIIYNIYIILKKYNLKVADREKNIQNHYNSFDNDDYVYNKEELKESRNYKNYNKTIIQNIKTNNKHLKQNLQNVTNLKQKLNVNTQISSDINKKTLSENDDNLAYKKPELSGFWSRLFFTQ